MIDQRPGVQRLISFLFFFTFLIFTNSISAQNGQQLFQQNCASCHGVNKGITGPALAGLETRGPWSDRKELYKWIHNPAGYMQKDAYTSGLKAQWNNVMMTGFPSLGDKDIDAIVEYINKVPAPVAKTTGGPEEQGDTSTKYSEDDNAILYGVLTLILAVVALIMLQVNSNLRKLADDKEGIQAHEPIPFYRNKTYITLLTLLLFVVGGFFVVKGAISLGRTKNYQPRQPIYYSHKVHVGVNQINCLYCHGGAVEGKHANIPSVNTCMNCHMTINEYSGTPLMDENGKEINGTGEIQKLYEYAGWDPSKKQYVNSGKPIEWIKIHNLPDHVYFNHSQHTVAGKVACQTCHGEIQNMGEVFQYSELSMGWCVNCHRETKVNFLDSSGNKGNKFYSMYEQYHNEIKSKKRDSITVSDIGGTECQKCHY